MNCLMKYCLCIIGLTVIILSAQAQQTIHHEDLNSLLINKTYVAYKIPEKRKILSFKNKHFITKLNPITYLSAGLLFVYQRIISEQIQADCAYHNSCSNYTKSQIEINGFRGFLLGINQLNNCFEGVSYDYPNYKITTDFKVMNPVEKIIH